MVARFEGTTYHMTYCLNDFTNSTTPRQTHITNAKATNNYLTKLCGFNTSSLGKSSGVVLKEGVSIIWITLI
ncbi:hypothetical protein CR513_01197, partial [Mucuna pruriens]